MSVLSLTEVLKPHVYVISESWSYDCLGWYPNTGFAPKTWKNVSPKTLVTLHCVVKASVLAQVAKSPDAAVIALWGQVPVIVAAVLSADYQLVSFDATMRRVGELIVDLTVRA